MNNRVSTAEEFRQAFLKALIEVEIPEYGIVQLRSSRYNPVVIEHDNLSAREFAVKLLGFVIYSPATTLDEIQTWDDQIIEKAIRAWLSGEDSNIWAFSEDEQFFQAIQQAYQGYLDSYIQNMQRVMQGFSKGIQAHLDSLRDSVHLIHDSMLRWQTDFQKIGDLLRQQANRFFENLPDLSYLKKIAEERERNSAFLDQIGFPYYEFLSDSESFAGLDNIDNRVQSATLTNRLLGKIRSPEFLQELEYYFQSSTILRHRWQIIQQALHAHNQRSYAIAIPALLTQIEGMYTDAIVLKSIVIKRKKKLYAKDPVTGEIRREENPKTGKLEPVQLHSLSWKIKETKKANNILLNMTSDILDYYFSDRNDILHGTNTSYPKAKYSIDLILIITMLAQVLSEFERKR